MVVLFSEPPNRSPELVWWETEGTSNQKRYPQNEMYPETMTLRWDPYNITQSTNSKVTISLWGYIVSFFSVKKIRKMVPHKLYVRCTFVTSRKMVSSQSWLSLTCLKKMSTTRVCWAFLRKPTSIETMVPSESSPWVWSWSIWPTRFKKSKWKCLPPFGRDQCLWHGKSISLVSVRNLVLIFLLCPKGTLLSSGGDSKVTNG